MEFYSELDSTEKDILCSCLTPVGDDEEVGKFKSRLPKLTGFWEAVNKDNDLEIVPVPNEKRKSGVENKKSEEKIKFFNAGQLNLSHPHLQSELQKIFNLLESHQITHHPETQISNFSYLKDYFSLS